MEVRRQHGSHEHPWLEPRRGAAASTVGPPPEDLAGVHNSKLIIMLTATDSKGLSATVTREHLPRLVDLRFETQPEGLVLNLMGEPVTAPSTVTSWAAWDLPVHAADQSGKRPLLGFDAWSHGGARSHAIATPASPANYRLRFTRSPTPARDTPRP